MLRSNFVYNPALKCMSYNGEVLEITSKQLCVRAAFENERFTLTTKF